MSAQHEFFLKRSFLSCENYMKLCDKMTVCRECFYRDTIKFRTLLRANVPNQKFQCFNHKCPALHKAMGTPECYTSTIFSFPLVVLLKFLLEIFLVLKAHVTKILNFLEVPAIETCQQHLGTPRTKISWT